MPQIALLLYGAALTAPLALFGILIWTGLERRLELAAQEQFVRGRVMRTRVAPAPSLALIVPAPSGILAPASQAGRSAA